MHSGIRVVLRDNPEKYLDEECLVLRSNIASAPGVQKIKKFERHVRGGYAVEIDLNPSQLQEFEDHLSSHGYSLVI